MSVRVGILGATGAVGQRFIQLLDDHPTFDLAAVTASADSAGKTYREAAKWRVDTPPDDVAEMEVTETTPAGIADADVDLLFSSLPRVSRARSSPRSWRRDTSSPRTHRTIAWRPTCR